MSDRKDDRLKHELRQWLDRAVETPEREGLAERIVHVLREVPPQPHRGQEPNGRKRPAAIAVAMAAAVLLMATLLVWQWLRPRRAERPPAGVPDPAASLLAHLDTDELERRLALLEELDELFDDRWQWLVECGDQLEMQVSEPLKARGHAQAVAVKLAILVRDAPDESFRVEEKTYVLTREQQAVEAVLQDGVARKLYFWAFPVDDGLFTYDVDLQAAQPKELSISSSGIIASGRPTKILSFTQGESEYRVYLLLIRGASSASRGTTREL